MTHRAALVSRATHDQWLDLRAQANARLQAGCGDDSDAFALARNVRRALGDVAQVDWAGIGVNVRSQRFNGSGMLRKADWPIEVIVRREDNSGRQRFTVAHELCHYLLRGSERLLDPASIEPFCDAFASELLVPQSRLDALRTIDGELPPAEEIVGLARRLKVNLSPVVLKLRFFTTRQPSFAVVAIPSPRSGLRVDLSCGTGGMGGIPEGRTIANLGTWGPRLNNQTAHRISGVDRINTRFVLPPRIRPRDLENKSTGPRSGAIAGTARWNAFQLNGGRMVITAMFTGVEQLTLNAPAAGRKRATSP